MHWTAETEAAMLEGGNEGVHRYYEQLVGQLNDMVYLIRGKLSKMARVTIGALAVIDVHARDVMKKVSKNNGHQPGQGLGLGLTLRLPRLVGSIYVVER